MWSPEWPEVPVRGCRLHGCRAPASGRGLVQGDDMPQEVGLELGSKREQQAQLAAQQAHELELLRQRRPGLERSFWLSTSGFAA